MSIPDATRLALFTTLWTAIWILPLPRLTGWMELAAGLIPFAAFGLRVFAGFFVGVPESDAVRRLAQPLLAWVEGHAGFPPYAWVLDGTVALGIVWFASAFDIPRRSRIATAWIIPFVALLSAGSLRATGLPFERLLATHLPAVVLAGVAGGMLAAVMQLTPSPIPTALRRRAAVVALFVVPSCVGVGLLLLACLPILQPERVSQAESMASLASGAVAAFAAWRWSSFERSRSRFLFAMAVGVAAGAVVALCA